MLRFYRERRAEWLSFPAEERAEFPEMDMVYEVLPEAFLAHFTPLAQEFGFERRDTEEAVYFEKPWGECQQSVRVSFECYEKTLTVDVQVAVRSMPLWQKAGDQKLREGHFVAMLFHFLPSLKRKSSGGRPVNHCNWHIHKTQMLHLTMKEMREGLVLACEFMDQFRTTQDVFDGFERGEFAPDCPEQIEWWHLLWEGKIDPQVDTHRSRWPHYRSPYAILSTAARGGESTGQSKGHRAPEVDRYFGGRDPYPFPEF